jgi:hypothetical protein
MFRVAIAASLIGMLLLSTLLLSRETMACPVEIPETLLSLYKKSPEIHLARFDRSVDQGVEEDSPQWTIMSVSKKYDIVSTLKGEHRKSFSYTESDYRSRSIAVSEPEVVPNHQELSQKGDVFSVESEDLSSEVRSGDMVLLFLSPESEVEDEEGAEPVSPTAKKVERKVTLVPTAGRFGVRKIDERDSAVYISQIKQLNSIFESAQSKQPALIAEWLISGIEDPVTRWDAAFELSQSIDEMTVADRRRNEKAKETDETEKFEMEISTDDPDHERVDVARQLTEIHKGRVINVFASAGQAGLTKITKTQVQRADYVLIELVKDWGGSNAAGLLLDRLRRGLLDRYDTATLMGSIAEVLGEDPELIEITESYGNLLSGNDEEKFTPEADESTVDDGPAVFRTYLEERNNVVGRFLATAQSRIDTGGNVVAKVSEN